MKQISIPSTKYEERYKFPPDGTQGEVPKMCKSWMSIVKTAWRLFELEFTDVKILLLIFCVRNFVKQEMFSSHVNDINK